MISSTSSRLITPWKNHHVSIILPCVWRSQAEIVESEFYLLNHQKKNSTNNTLSSFIIYVSYQAKSRCFAELKVIWGFPKIGLPQNNHPFYLRISHEINHPNHPAILYNHWGSSRTMESSRGLPSGYFSHSLWWTNILPWKITMLLMGKSTISMAIFHGKMLVHQRVYHEISH